MLPKTALTAFMSSCLKLNPRMLFLKLSLKKDSRPFHAPKEKKLRLLRLITPGSPTGEVFPWPDSIKFKSCFSGVRGLSCAILISLPAQ
jgi:hypothetical protein